MSALREVGWGSVRNILIDTVICSSNRWQGSLPSSLWRFADFVIAWYSLDASLEKRRRYRTDCQLLLLVVLYKRGLRGESTVRMFAGHSSCRFSSNGAMRMRFKTIGLAGLVALAATPMTAVSQLARTSDGVGTSAQRTIAVEIMVGTFNDDMAEDRYVPFAAARLNREFNRFALWELGLSYARSKETVVIQQNGSFEPRDVPSPVITGDIGIQVKLPLGRVEPYTGIAIGVFTRSYENQTFDRATGASLAANVGLRVRTGQRFKVRAEMIRLRSDDYGDFGAFNYEHALGVSFAF